MNKMIEEICCGMPKMLEYFSQIDEKIRKQKDIQIMAKASGNKELVQESQQKITQLTKKYKELSDVSGLPTKMERMRVSGYRRTSVAKMK